MARKKELDDLREQKLREAKDYEAKMRAKASTIGNIVGKGVPVSMTEVGMHNSNAIFLCVVLRFPSIRTIMLLYELGIPMDQMHKSSSGQISCPIMRFYCD